MEERGWDFIRFSLKEKEEEEEEEEIVIVFSHPVFSRSPWVFSTDPRRHARAPFRKVTVVGRQGLGMVSSFFLFLQFLFNWFNFSNCEIFYFYFSPLKKRFWSKC